MNKYNNQILIKYKKQKILVDKQVALLMKELLKAEIFVVNCYNDYPEPNWITIDFVTAYFASMFLNIVNKYDKHDLEMHSMYWRSNPIFNRKNTWRFIIRPFDWSLEQWVDDDGYLVHKHGGKNGKVEFDFSVSAAIPYSDYQEIVTKLQKFNKYRRIKNGK